MFFYLSLGSNIDSECSAVRMIRHLCREFGCIGAYPWRYTRPEGMVSSTPFLNTLVVLKSDLNSADLKERLNSIEQTMGRDRDDPLRSVKSRTADIDIVGTSRDYGLEIFADATELYIAACLNFQGDSPDLSSLGLASYKRPATIYLDAFSGDIVVIDDELQGFKNGLKPSFERQ